MVNLEFIVALCIEGLGAWVITATALVMIMTPALGFLAVLIGSLLYRDRRADEMWDELYVRSNTGIGRAAAAAH